VRSEHPIGTSEQSVQIERLIFMNEQANRRSYGLETAIQEFGIVPTYGAVPIPLIAADNSSGHEQILPTEMPAIASSSASTVSRVNSRVYTNDEFLGLASEFFQSISSRDLDDMLDQVRFLLKVLEDAKSSDDAERCSIDKQICLNSIETIRSHLISDTKRTEYVQDPGQMQSVIDRASAKEQVQLVLY
jgi:hypothetical protein